MLKSSIIKDGLKEKRALCIALLDDEEEVAQEKKKSKAKHLGETVAPKKG